MGVKRGKKQLASVEFKVELCDKEGRMIQGLDLTAITFDPPIEVPSAYNLLNGIGATATSAITDHCMLVLPLSVMKKKAVEKEGK